MKTQRSARQTRVIRDRKERVKPNCEEAVRRCEEAAARIQAAGKELAACWTTLARELATGCTANSVLRKRAWCNVLELRLLEQAHALEQARLEVDVVWHEIMNAVRSRELLSRLLRKDGNELSATHQVWPLLAQGAAAPPSKLNQLKKP